jgi:hypothetical protein
VPLAGLQRVAGSPNLREELPGTALEQPLSSLFEGRTGLPGRGVGRRSPKSRRNIR